MYLSLQQAPAHLVGPGSLITRRNAEIASDKRSDRSEKKKKRKIEIPVAVGTGRGRRSDSTSRRACIARWYSCQAARVADALYARTSPLMDANAFRERERDRKEEKREKRGQQNALATRGRFSARASIFRSAELRYNCSVKIRRVNSIDKAAPPRVKIMHD